MNRFFMFFLTMTLSSFVYAGQTWSVEGSDARKDYVAMYKDIAIEEMQRTGIPASIKLAQGILESNSGRSELAVKANNHFGIKCGGDWNGQSFYKKDDDYNKRGKLIESCFRSYNSPEYSFVAHSEFLTDPRKSARYGFLFELKSTDYKGWAHGLKKSGYATNPQYASLLIRIIEEMGLHDYDRPGTSVRKEKTTKTPSSTTSKGNTSQVRQPSKDYHFATINNVDMVYAKEGSTIHAVAAVTGKSAKSLMKYNEEIKSVNQKLPENYPVFLQPKRNSFVGKKKYHTTTENELLTDISKLYGVKTKKLSKRNEIPENAGIAPGQKVKLKGLFKNKKYPVKTVSKIHITKKEVKLEVNNTHQQYHEVQAGDTLYAISRKYGVAVDSIKALNNLNDNAISVGQKLRIK